MALSKTVVLKNNFGLDNTFENVYVKVENISGGKERLAVSVSLTKDGKHLQTQGYGFTPSVEFDAPNFIKQAYQYLKTLPEFAGAVDC